MACRSSGRGQQSRPVGPQPSEDSESDEPPTRRRGTSISDMAIAAEDVGVEDDQTWEMIVPRGKEQETVGIQRKMRPGQVERCKDMVKKA
eukprot:4416457-Pyramimonas_sp.AAC.1